MSDPFSCNVCYVSLSDDFAHSICSCLLLLPQVSLLESRVVGLERRVASTEESATLEKGKTATVRSDCELRSAAIEAGGERSVELASREVGTLQKQLADLDMTAAESGSVHEKELQRLLARCARELTDVEDRVRIVGERKDHAVKEKERELKEVTARSKALTEELDELRIKDIDLEG